MCHPTILSSAEEIQESLPPRKSCQRSFGTFMDLFWCISKRMGQQLTVLVNVQCCEMKNVQFEEKKRNAVQKLLHHNSARPHTATATIKTVQLPQTSTPSLQPRFGAKRLSHLRSSKGGVARSQINVQWWSEGSGAHLPSRAAEKLLRRNTEGFVTLTERQSCTKMNFLKKLRFWKRRRNDAVNRDIATTYNRNS